MEKYYTQEEVAQELEISTSSVKNHIKTIQKNISKEKMADFFNNSNQPTKYGVELIKEQALKGNSQLQKIYDLKSSVKNLQSEKKELEKEKTELIAEISRLQSEFIEYTKNTQNKYIEMQEQSVFFANQVSKQLTELKAIEEKKEQEPKKSFWQKIFNN